VSAVHSGRDYIQQHGDDGRHDIDAARFFKALKLQRTSEGQLVCGKRR